MITILIVSQIISWVLALATIVALLAVAKQVGVLHERVAPIGALAPAQGPAAGDYAPRLDVSTLEGAIVSIGAPMKPGTKRLLFFVSAQCPICKKLIPFARSFAKAEGIELVFVGDDSEEKQRALVARAGIQDYPFINDTQVGRAFAVDKLPHAVLLGDDGRIVARGLVNSREHLESLVVAQETGLSSVQDYLRSRLSQNA